MSNDQKKGEVQDDLLDLYDEFVGFNNYCAFLCDAMSSLLSDAVESEPDIRTVMGLKQHCGDLKAKAKRLEGMLGALRS